MAAGSQSVEGWAKKLDPVQLGKKIHFSSDRTLFNSRASPRCWRRFAYVLKLLTQRCYWIVTKIGRVGRAKADANAPRAIRLISFLECFPTTCPFPGRPPPSAPKMAGIIPLVHNITFSVRSSENCRSLPFPRQCFLFTAILLNKGKDGNRAVWTPLLAKSSRILFLREKVCC